MFLQTCPIIIVFVTQREHNKWSDAIFECSHTVSRMLHYRRTSVRFWVFCVIGLTSCLALTGCGSRVSDDPGVYYERLLEAESREVRATWVFGFGSDTKTLIRGLGRWEEDGQFFWRTELYGTVVSVRGIGDKLVLEDGSELVKKSAEGKDRLRRDLFAEDVLQKAVASDMKLTRENGRLVGTAKCPDADCTMTMVLTIDSLGRPSIAQLTMQYATYKDRFEFAYDKLGR